ncbi:TetR/AcrR family transcriptional regulator [Lactobacillaceae bacterium L1_55_11]|nr:TetR/AcrR family transcriptional regulator [Lactobacillaceae bacterium L1_55_11]
MAATQRAQEINLLTKQWITDALFDLLNDHPLDKISVSQVSQKAGISRTVFYNHFDSLTAVIEADYQKKLDRYFDPLTAQPDFKKRQGQLAQAFLQLVPDLKRSIAGNYTETLRSVTIKKLEDLYEHSNLGITYRGQQRHYWIQFIAAGVFQIWLTWIENGQKESVAQITVWIVAFHG